MVVATITTPTRTTQPVTTNQQLPTINQAQPHRTTLRLPALTHWVAAIPV
jgi:hypothetical protein